eukprot:Seg816.3 transcript_id=Seg816.3/GoldUCD/mRNA.D3Y31 product="hypothetical protein" protein_id=Seg816.3/GoldUCD/D3Y31
MGSWYYHYTDQTSLDRILKSGYIKSSTDTQLDCAFGMGVYLTTLNPNEHSKEVIAKNNYEHGWRGGLARGKTDSFIQIWIPSGTRKLRKAKDPQYPSRDVYLYSDDLYLCDFNYKHGHVSDWVKSGVCATGGAVIGGIIGGPVGAVVGVGVGGFIGYLFS